jgi:hypothetical protein
MPIIEQKATVYITEDGQTHMSREAAEAHEAKARREAAFSWLSDALDDIGGASYDFDVNEAAGWVLDNYALIGEKMGAGMGAAPK